MRIHILGICGTFMGGLAKILKESGHIVSGADINFYPPMSNYIETIGIEMIKGYEKDSMPKADLYVIGNALSRGNECVEEILEKKLPYTSGPELLGKELKGRKVYAISGTHGKTSTSYMLAHIFSSQNKDIGYLIGGISKDFKDPAHLGTDPIFVIEADEYDSAFFDKRSKFIHYSPNNLVINNIEFDHADIFENIEDIKKQFHHLIKIIPKSGNIIYFKDNENTYDLINKGTWCEKIEINSDLISINLDKKILKVDQTEYSLKDLPLIGEHNFKNYVCAILAAKLGGININESVKSLKNHKGVKRRMDLVYKSNKLDIYDDFAHHPTAIHMSCKGIKTQSPDKKILGIIELGSNTMSSGYHKENLLSSYKLLDKVFVLDPNKIYINKNAYDSIDDIIKNVKEIIYEYDIILVMSNKDSQKFIEPLIKYIEKK